MNRSYFRRTFIRPSLNNFLNHVNFNNIYRLPNAQTLAYQSRQRFVGMDLLRLNVRREAHRLQIQNQRLINLATNHIWNSNLTLLQRIQFIRLARNVNNIIQNSPFRIHIARINNIPQITNDPFERDFFGGTDFYDNNNPDYLDL